MSASNELATLYTRFDKRFGPEYFKRVPAEPGVFWMNDAKRRLLLIGHSKNLKFKLLLLRSYLLNAKPKTESEITNQIHDINWTHCVSSKASMAILKKIGEEYHSAYQLEHPDLSNYVYICLHFKKNKIQISVQDCPQKSQLCFGAFKGKNQTLMAYSSLLRWLRFYFYSGSVMQWPSPFNKSIMPTKFILQIPENVDPHAEVEQLIKSFFSGESKDLLLNFVEKIEQQRESLDKFTRLWLHKDLERLDRFFRNSITRNKNIIQSLQLKTTYIDSEWASPLRIKPYN